MPTKTPDNTMTTDTAALHTCSLYSLPGYRCCRNGAGGGVMTSPKLVCSGCGKVGVGIFSPLCPACEKALAGGERV